MATVDNRAIALAIAATVSLGTATRIWITEPAPVDKKLALYQAQCNTLYVSVMAELAKQGHYFKAGEAFRTKEQAAMNAIKGVGIKDSAHTYSLAWDNFRVSADGTVSWKHEDYELYGKTWVEAGKKVGIKTNWGGNFRRKDDVHISCTSPTGSQ